MRFKITLERNKKTAYIPVDYQYYLGSLIYRIIGEANKDFASFIHTQGYGEGNKKFKFFNYSPLDLKPFYFRKEKGIFELQGEQINFSVSFYITDIAENFIKGLFINRELYIGNHDNGIDFTITKAESVPLPVFNETMHYSLKSPLVLSVKREDNTTCYLSPEDKRYTDFFINQLIEKYKGTLVSLPVYEGEASDNRDFEWDFKIGSDFKSALHVIKPGTKEQTRIKGYLYDFRLTAPETIHEMAYSCGFGEKNAMGFGWGELL